MPASWAAAVGRVVAADPRLLVHQERARAARAARACRALSALGRDVAALARVLGREDRHVRVGVVDLVELDLATRVAMSSIGASRTNDAADGVEPEADERPRVPRGASSRTTSSISGRPGGCERTSTCHPGSGVDAVDEHARVRLDPRVHRRDPSRTRASPSRAPTTASAARALGAMAGDGVEEGVASERQQLAVGLGRRPSPCAARRGAARSRRTSRPGRARRPARRRRSRATGPTRRRRSGRPGRPGG